MYKVKETYFLRDLVPGDSQGLVWAIQIHSFAGRHNSFHRGRGKEAASPDYALSQVYLTERPNSAYEKLFRC